MQISNSKAETYRRCPNKYRYRYPMKLRPKMRGPRLAMGSWMHLLLQSWYEDKDWVQPHRDQVKEYDKLFVEEREILGNLPAECFALMKRYMRHYADDHKRFNFIDSEMDEIITLPNGLRFNIIVDLILEDKQDGGLWAYDHKFREKLAEIDDMLLDPQLTRYYYGLEALGYKNLRGVCYNEVRTKPPTVPALLKSGELTRKKNQDTDVYTYMREIRRFGLDPEDYRKTLVLIAQRQKDRFFRRTSLPKDKPMIRTMMRDLSDTADEIGQAEMAEQYPRTFEKSCKWGCDYQDLCLAELHGADISSLIKMNYEVSRRGNQP